MNKKKYQAPALRALDIDLTDLMAGSTTRMGVNVNESHSASEAMSRGNSSFDIWGEDEE
jgi:hypothetical protein